MSFVLTLARCLVFQRSNSSWVNTAAREEESWMVLAAEIPGEQRG